MITVDQHRAEVLGLVSALAPVTVGVGDSLGLVLAEPVAARVDMPGFDNSAMDGYAVRAADLEGASEESPISVPVAGDIAAGDTTEHRLSPGQTWRIMTGAPMPVGADAVVPVESSDGGATQAVLSLAPEPGRHVRPRGSDVRAGDVVIASSTRIGPGQLALIAAANVPEVRVHPRPRVAVMSTGDELAAPGSALRHGQIVDSNSVMLAALVRAAGAEVAFIGHLDDDADAMRAFFDHPDGDPDLVLTSGGVSMGAYDTVKEVLRETGSVDFVKVAMRPGMPQGAGVIGARRLPVITLPGNPVSSLVSFHVFVLPAIEAMAGRAVTELTGIPVVAGKDWHSTPEKVEFTRVRVDNGTAHPARGQGSHMLSALADGTHLAVVPVGVGEVHAGDPVACLPLLGS